MNYFLASQLLLCVTIAFDLASFQFKRRGGILICLFFAAAFNSMHFFLLEQWTAASLMAMGSLRYFVGVFFTSKKIAGLFMLVSVFVSFFTYSGLISVLACLGSLLKTGAAFCKSDKYLRQLMMLGTLFWIIHNYLASSPLGVVMEALFLVSNIIGYYRYYSFYPIKNPKI